ncbi:hypothetical protein AB4865_12250 [Capnocytophaga sp. ARDL2]|uniref:hypothetical protein n=1 Tax=Capnocytophaga sp. ARDL2 TaxID=3238809 RepID=UPI003558F3B5
MKKIALLTVALLSLNACTTEEDDYVISDRIEEINEDRLLGTWRITGFMENGWVQPHIWEMESFQFVFLPNETLLFPALDAVNIPEKFPFQENGSYPYKIVGHNKVHFPSVGVTYEFSINGSSLVFTKEAVSDGEIIIMQRIE